MVDWGGYGTPSSRKEPVRLDLGTIPGDLGESALDLVSPLRWKRSIRSLIKGSKDLHPSKWSQDPGYALRQLSQTPAGLLPLLPTISKLTSGEGRRDLAKHPLFPLLDIGSTLLLLTGVGAPAGAAIKAGEVGEAAADAGRLAELGEATRTAMGGAPTGMGRAGKLGGAAKAAFESTGLQRQVERVSRAVEHAKTHPKATGLELGSAGRLTDLIERSKQPADMPASRVRQPTGRPALPRLPPPR